MIIPIKIESTIMVLAMLGVIISGLIISGAGGNKEMKSKWELRGGVFVFIMILDISSLIITKIWTS
jgi:hypothetical protein